MRELKFRAIIPERNAVIYFTLRDLLDDKFSHREILCPWLKAGNQPDQFTDREDGSGRPVYEGDVLKGRQANYIVKWNAEEAAFRAERYQAYIPAYQWQYHKVIGNVKQNPELVQP